MHRIFLNSFTFARGFIFFTGITLAILNATWLYLSYKGMLLPNFKKFSLEDVEKATLIETFEKYKKDCSTVSKNLQLASFPKDKSANIVTGENIRAVPLKTKVFLSMGIPTTLRKTGGKYLFETVQSLIENSSEEERNDSMLAIVFGNNKIQDNINMANHILKQFKPYYESGFLHIIQPPSTYYPNLNGLRRTYNDSEERVKWRSKQVLDYAYVMNYSSTFSDYYLLLEDDIIASPHYITAIREFIPIPKKFWVQLDFTSFTSIGKLYKSTVAKKLATFLMTFYAEHPVDFLLQYFNHILLPPEQNTKRSPSLFQHVGIVSSLNNKVQTLQDPDFLIIHRKFKIKNPPAKLYTNIETVGSYFIEMAYSSAPGYFWGINPKKGKYIQIVFHKPIQISSIFILSGISKYPNDILEFGRLEASHDVLIKHSHCHNYSFIDKFENGSINIAHFEKLEEKPIQCLRITITKHIKHWLIISEIAIFTV